LRRCRRLPSPEVTKGQIVDAIKYNDASTIPDIKRCTTADNGCGDCSLSTGFSHRILKCTLRGMGKKALRASAPQFPSRTPNSSKPSAWKAQGLRGCGQRVSVGKVRISRLR